MGVLIGQERAQRQRLEMALVEMQKGRLTSEEQTAAEREAFENERRAFVENRQRMAAVVEPPPPPPPPVPEAPQAPDLGTVLQSVMGRLSAIEVALSSNRGHIPTAVAAAPSPFATAAPGFAPGAAPSLYNPAVTMNGATRWPWRP